MNVALVPALAAAGSLVPAVVALAAPGLEARAFAALGVTKTSPLPLRQAWFAAVFLALPAGGALAAGLAALRAQPHRAAYAALAGANVLAVIFAVVASLLDD